MIRLLHFADLHLGVETYGRTDPATNLNTRVLDELQALHTIIDIAVQERVDAVLFAGDAYRSKDPNVTFQREFARALARLIAAEIPTVLLTGNHDVPNTSGRASSVEVFRALPLQWIHVVDEPKVFRLETRSGSLQVIALPWLSRSLFLSDQVSTVASTDEEITAEIAEVASSWLRNRIAELDSDLPAIALAHVHLIGGEVGIERELTLGNAVTLSPALFDVPQLAYTALGHLHRHQNLGIRRPVVYSGSLERLDFGDEDQPKGFVLLEVEAGRPARWTFQELPARRFLTIDVALQGEEPATEQIMTALTHHDLRAAIVRIRATGTLEQLAAIRHHEVSVAAADAFAFVGISRIPIEARRVRIAASGNAHMSIEEVLDRYWLSKHIPEERRRLLLQAAKPLIMLEQEGS